MYHYRNVKAGVIIKTACEVTGKNWGPVEEEELYTADDMEDPYEDAFDEDPAEETSETVPVEEAPEPKPKASRKGKK